MLALRGVALFRLACVCEENVGQGGGGDRDDGYIQVDGFGGILVRGVRVEGGGGVGTGGGTQTSNSHNSTIDKNGNNHIPGTQLRHYYGEPY